MVALKYSLKVWLTTAVVAPLLTVVRFYDSSSLAEVPYYYITVAVIGALLSIPSWLCFWLAVYLIAGNFSTVVSKTLLSVIALILTVAPFFLLKLIPDEAITVVAYSISIVACVWLYTLRQDIQSLPA